MKVKKSIIAVLLLVFVLNSCGYDDTEINEIGLVYSGGVTEEKVYTGILEPGATWESVGYGSTVYKYPIDQRSWVSGDDAPNVTVVSNDEVRLSVPYQLYFKLNTNEDTLVDFHEDIGVKVQAYTDAGWVEMLNTYFAPQVDRAMDEAALNYDWRELRSSNEARAGFQRDVVTSLKRKITEVVGGDYFCGPNYDGGDTACGNFTFTVGKPEPVDPALVTAIEQEQQVDAEIQRVEAESRRQEAQNRQLEIEREAVEKDIELLGPDNYAYLKCVESGAKICIPPNSSIPLEFQRLPLGGE